VVALRCVRVMSSSCISADMGMEVVQGEAVVEYQAG
jgi:hypothetical protein